MSKSEQLSKKFVWGTFAGIGLMLWIIFHSMDSPADGAAARAAADPPKQQLTMEELKASLPVEVIVQGQEIDKFHTLVRTDARMVDLCAQAGMVKATFLQSNDDVHVKKWASIEHAFCSQTNGFDNPLSHYRGLSFIEDALRDAG
jgi:hypothetical protein